MLRRLGVLALIAVVGRAAWPDVDLVDPLESWRPLELVSLNEQASKTTEDRPDPEPDRKTCVVKSDAEIWEAHCRSYDCRAKEAINPGSGCSADRGSCDLQTGKCRCSDYQGGCDCSVNCQTHAEGCRKCTTDQCVACASPMYFVCPGRHICHKFCPNNCNGHKCDTETGKCKCDKGWGGTDCTVQCTKFDKNCISCSSSECQTCDFVRGFNSKPLCKVCKRHSCDCSGNGNCDCNAKCKCFNGYGGTSCKHRCAKIHKGCTACHEEAKTGIWRCDKCDKKFNPTPKHTTTGSKCEPQCPMGQSMKNGQCETCGKIWKLKLKPTCGEDMPNDLCLTRASSDLMKISQATGGDKVSITLQECIRQKPGLSSKDKATAANQMWLKRPIKIKLGTPPAKGTTSERREEKTYDTFTIPDEWMTKTGILAQNDQFVKPRGEEYCLTSVMDGATGNATSQLTVRVCEVKKEMSKLRDLQLWSVSSAPCEDNSPFDRSVETITLRANNLAVSPKDGAKLGANVEVVLRRLSTKYFDAQLQQWTAFDGQTVSECTL